MAVRRLTLLRHGKSGYPDGAADHERPLGKRGLRDVPRMAAYAAAQGLVPDLVLCSDACRTAETAKLFLAGFSPRPALILQPDLYLASPHTLLGAARACPADVPHVLLIGHNPGMEQVAALLAQEQMISRMPTAALVSFVLQTDEWTYLHPSHCVCTHRMAPKGLPEA